jgi:uncharacterized membrane protein YhaH (DUF805 family)
LTGFENFDNGTRMSYSRPDVWFYTHDGEKIGPVTFGYLQDKAKSSAIQPLLDMVWTDGMDEWRPAGEIEGLFEFHAPSVDSPNPADYSRPDVWFYTHDGEKIGPVTFGYLQDKAKKSAIHPRIDMIWAPSMDEWRPAGEIKGLFERRAASDSLEAMAVSSDPHKSPEQESVAEFMGKEDNWPGVRRRSYLLGILLFPILWGIAFYAGTPFLNTLLGPEITRMVTYGANFVPTLVWLNFSLKRLMNLGMSRWWFFGNFVPLLNLWVGYRCFACPGGYAFHKKIDGPGIGLAIIYWLVLVAVVAVVGLCVAILLGAWGSPEWQQQAREALHHLITSVR